MSNTLRYLECLAIHPDLDNASVEQRAALMDTLQVQMSERAALLQGDVSALLQLIGGRKSMVGIQFPGDDEPQPEQTPRPDEELPDDDDDQDGTAEPHQRLN